MKRNLRHNFTDYRESHLTGLGVTSAVGSFPRGVSPYKCEEMAGNVWEWCSDWFDENYYAQSPKDNPQGPVLGSGRVHRDGGWVNIAGLCRAALRSFDVPDLRGALVGFRLVKTPS